MLVCSHLGSNEQPISNNNQDDIPIIELDDD